MLFKNLYYTSVQFDLKEIGKKIGRAFDPLFTHPYHQAIIKVKQQEFDSNSSKILEVKEHTGCTIYDDQYEFFK